jgi:hypothetical protein
MCSPDRHEIGMIAWRDLTVKDAARVRDFYAGVVGWKPEPVGMEGYDDFNMIAPSSGDPATGICHARGENAGLPPQWLRQHERHEEAHGQDHGPHEPGRR